MSLSEKLAQIAEKAQERLPEEVRSQMKQATEELKRSGILEKVTGEGTKLPSFVMPNQHGNKVSSADLLAQGPLVLTFYRGSW